MTVPHVVRGHADPSAARQQQRDVRRGVLVVIGYGAFADRAEWDAATEWEQHIARTKAAQQRSPGTIVSHASAVVLHRLPWISPVPDRVVLTDPRRTTTQRTRYVDKAPGADRRVRTTLVDGLVVTALADTVVDVVLRHDRGRALAVADAAVRRGVDPSALSALVREREPVRAHKRASQVLELARGLSESAGESITHLALSDAGCAHVVQQHEFRDADGPVGRVDFWLPDHGLVVEFDGLAKYRDQALRGGRSADEVVVAEKLREDRLRALPEVRGVVRPIWRDVVPGGRFPSMLAAAGVPIRRGLWEPPSW
ncbi:hypothetical protein L2091_07715 [Curtobacterium albidum]|uniref:hypothetical protein n=1 Tax=Curtobacterium citreum TaxID=2036 RepID=UPI0020261BF0|nr:hypothetical protein [Curtobacterium albidum]MCL9665114.1 hypothetical protein [Curtobacterium albidum]